MTLRSRSIAVVTDGSFLDASPAGAGPALDWIIAQIKYHSALDPYPFIVEKDIDWDLALKDLANSYGTVLVLENHTFKEVPEDILVVNHQDVVSLCKSEVTDAEQTANVIACLVHNKKKGLAKKEECSAGIDYDGVVFKEFKYYNKLIKDGRDVYTHALELHKFYNGTFKVIQVKFT